jgi:hypothetical protein
MATELLRVAGAAAIGLDTPRQVMDKSPMELQAPRKMTREIKRWNG